jgi:hypothetical protein
MEQNPSWEAGSHIASQEILCHLWNRVHERSLTLHPIMNDEIHCIFSNPIPLIFILMLSPIYV